MWHHRWEGPNLRSWPTDVKSTVNFVVLGLAQSSAAGTGSIEYSPSNGQSVADAAADIRSDKARGVSTVMGIGGSGTTISLTTSTQAHQMFASIQGMVSTYGISGIDIDIEPSGSGWNQTALKQLCSQLKATYGSGFIIGLTPGLYGEHTEKWLSVARLLGNDYDYMAPMLYDFPEAGDSRLNAVAVTKVQTMLAGGVPLNKQILGFMLRPDAGYVNSSPASVMLSAWKTVKAQYPGIRGAFIWEDKIEAAQGWAATRTLGVHVNP